MVLRAIIAGCGGYLPATRLSNDELAALKGLDTSDAWIRERTGIRQRHIAPRRDRLRMGAAAARRALERRRRCVEVDASWWRPRRPTRPSPRRRASGKLGVTKGFAFDLAAACTGFIYGVGIADAFIRTGQARCVLVIGTEVYSRILDWTDRGTCVFATRRRDAAAPGRAHADRGVLSCHMHSDGRLGDIRISRRRRVTGRTGLLRMAGKEVFRHAVTKLAAVVDEALAANGLGHEDVRWLVPHQANRRIIDAMGKKLHLPPERVVVTVERHANTSAASVPLALAEAYGDGRITAGDLVVMEAIGGG